LYLRVLERHRLRAYALAGVLAAVVIGVTAQPFHLALPLKLAAERLRLQADGQWFGAAKGLRAVEYHGYVRARERGSFLSMQGPELNPKRMRLQGLPNRLASDVPVVEISRQRDQVNDLTMLPEHTRFDYHFNISAASRLQVTINQFYFPGWIIRIDGKEWPWFLPSEGPVGREQVGDRKAVTVDARGRMVIAIPHPGHYQVRAWYDGPPGWEARNTLMAILTLLLLFVYHVRKKLLGRLEGMRRGQG
jgi:hypothetical protein